MKKKISLLLAVMMVLSVFSSVNFSAYAQELQIVSGKFNSATPITVIENCDGYWDKDSDGEEFFNYQYWCNEGDSFTINLSDGSVRTYVYSEYYNAEEDCGYLTFLDEKGNEADVEIYVSDKQYENHWKVGTYNAEALFYYDYEYIGSVDFPVTVVENPYSSITYTPVEPFEVIENHSSYGYWNTDEETGEDYFYYWGYDPKLGDKITLQLKNGSKAVYTNTFDEDAENSYFVSENGEVIEWGDFRIEDNQYEGDGWYPDCKNAKCTFIYLGLTCDIPVTVKANPYSSVEFIPAQPVQFIENYDGEMEYYDEDSSYFCYYCYYPHDGDKLVVHFTDKSKNAKTLVFDSDSGRFVADDGSSIGDFWMSSNQCCEEWKVGGKGYTNRIEVLGFDVEFPVEIVANPYKNVEFISAEPIEVIENCNGNIEKDDNGNEYFYYYDSYSIVYNEGNVIRITMTDGSVAEYISDGDEFYDSDGNRLDFDYNHNQYDKHWVKGAENFITITVLGIETKVPVTIIENPVKNVEFSCDSITCKENTWGHWYYDEENGDKFFIYDLTFASFKEGDTITVNMKDGTSKVYTCKENVDGYLYRANFFDENDNRLEIWDDVSDQYENPWVVGEHTAKIYISNYDVYAEIPIVITKGTQQDCWHNYYEDWHNVNGYLTKVCVGCGYQNKIPFVDLGNFAKYGDYIEYTSVENSFLKGTNPPVNNVFAPARTINRAMLVTILYRMAGEPYANGGNPYKTSPFTDITDPDVYYYDAACWALKNGVTTETTFKPFNDVTREQTATFLYRYAQDIGMVYDDDYKSVNLSRYHDAGSISHFAVDAMKWANYYGMITGTEQGYANPQGATQRIHATKILYHFGYACEIGI